MIDFYRYRGRVRQCLHVISGVYVLCIFSLNLFIFAAHFSHIVIGIAVVIHTHAFYNHTQIQSRMHWHWVNERAAQDFHAIRINKNKYTINIQINIHTRTMQGVGQGATKSELQIFNLYILCLYINVCLITHLRIFLYCSQYTHSHTAGVRRRCRQACQSLMHVCFVCCSFNIHKHGSYIHKHGSRHPCTYTCTHTRTDTCTHTHTHGAGFAERAAKDAKDVFVCMYVYVWPIPNMFSEAWFASHSTHTHTKAHTHAHTRTHTPCRGSKSELPRMPRTFSISWNAPTSRCCLSAVFCVTTSYTYMYTYIYTYINMCILIKHHFYVYAHIHVHMHTYQHFQSLGMQ